MPQHAVSGIDRLVGQETRQPEQEIGQRGGHNGVGEILRQRFDRPARNTRGIKILQIPTHEVPYSIPANFKAPGQSDGNCFHMVGETALCNEDRRQQAFDDGRGR